MQIPKPSISIVTCAMLLCLAPLKLPAQAEQPSTGKWHNEIALSYISGFGDLVDAIQENFSYSTSWEVPIGLSYRGYYQMNNGFGIGGSIGPAVAVFGDVSAYVVPVGIDLRYAFRGQKVAVVLRGGVRYPIAGGDYIEGSSAGLLAAAAVEFPIRSNRMAWGIEASYDSSEVEVQAGWWRIREIKVHEFGLSVYFRF